MLWGVNEHTIVIFVDEIYGEIDISFQELDTIGLS